MTDLHTLLPHLLQVLPHDLQRVALAVVGSDCIAAVAQDGQGHILRTACVPELVLHPVAQGVDGDLGVAHLCS